MPKKEVLIGFTYGDPTSIGPEILLKSLRTFNSRKLKPIIVGHKNVLQNAKRLILKNDFEIDSNDISILNNLSIGKPSKSSGRHAHECLQRAVNLAKKKKIKGIITGPVSKEIVSKFSPGFTGQTDQIAKACGLTMDEIIMLFVANDLRISLLTRHIPIKKVCKKLSKAAIKTHLKILNKELKKWFGIKKPKIGLLGVNPHAGENGLIGEEDKKIILPAIKELRKKGVNVYGPLSPDATLADAGQRYLNDKKQEYDAFVSIFHDQALPMFKAVAGKQGVNVSIGLPFIRVSPDHGTAFDIAGKNKADHAGYDACVKFLETISL